MLFEQEVNRKETGKPETDEAPGSLSREPQELRES